MDYSRREAYFVAYLKRYPHGVFAPLARNKLKREAEDLVPEDYWKENNRYLKELTRLEKKSGLRTVGKRYFRWLATLDDTTRNKLLMAASKRNTFKRFSNTLDIFRGAYTK